MLRLGVFSLEYNIASDTPEIFKRIVTYDSRTVTSYIIVAKANTLIWLNKTAKNENILRVHVKYILF